MGIVLAMVLVTLWFSGYIEIIIWRRLHVLKQSLRQSQDSFNAVLLCGSSKGRNVHVPA
jgi:hypothetical protein